MFAHSEVLLSVLERQELEAPNGIPSSVVYSQLLALCLYRHDSCKAKNLWKRIPQPVKSICPELEEIWNVGQHMFKQDHAAMNTALNSVNWSAPTVEIMKALQENEISRMLNCIAEKYSVILLDAAVIMSGLTREQLIVECKKRGWKFGNDYCSHLSRNLPSAPIIETSNDNNVNTVTESDSVAEK